MKKRPASHPTERSLDKSYSTALPLINHAARQAALPCVTGLLFAAVLAWWVMP